MFCRENHKEAPELSVSCLLLLLCPVGAGPVQGPGSHPPGGVLSERPRGSGSCRHGHWVWSKCCWVGYGSGMVGELGPAL